jgi:hypothetical protein
MASAHVSGSITFNDCILLSVTAQIRVLLDFNANNTNEQLISGNKSLEATTSQIAYILNDIDVIQFPLASHLYNGGN